MFDEEADVMVDTPAQEEFLAITRKSQEAVIAAIKTWVEAVKTTTSRLEPLTDRLPRLPQFSAPLADKLPGPEETVANAYRLAEQVLASQRKFAEDLLKMMTPLIPARVERTQDTPAPESAPARSAPERSEPAGGLASPAAKSTSAGSAAKSTAGSAKRTAISAKSTAGSAAKRTAGSAAKRTAGSAAKSTSEGTAAQSTPKGTAAKGTPKGTAAV
jgi:hypothetical protein